MKLSVVELIPLVESRLPVASGPAHTPSAACPWRHGAVALAAETPDTLFGAASSLSGILDLTLHAGMGDAWRLDSVLGSYQQFRNHGGDTCSDLGHCVQPPVLRSSS